ncbi:MAG TPA: hypothetical protein VGS06_46305, partial [Streptosporangiaceae bacterium]|nr:hypothetical protein [Streptosporangiaceae bacterium]
TPAVKWAAFGLSAYEAGAILTGRYPTLTKLSARHRWLGPVLVAALAVHLYRAPAAPRRLTGFSVRFPHRQETP